jgi:flagellar assembly protein FliH
MPVFRTTATKISPFEFRSLSKEDADEMTALAQSGGGQPRSLAQKSSAANKLEGVGQDWRAMEDSVGSAIETARKEGYDKGDREGRCTAKAEMEAEMNQSVTRERTRVLEAVNQFRGVRDKYFAEVEQEVVKLSLAIAARVLHREAQIDPLLLAGVVRVAMEKMADRTGVVLRVAAADVGSWEQVFSASKESERPSVAEDARLERGDCVLETRMGTVELGVSVQLEEIEKGFFDLLHHRPVE